MTNKKPEIEICPPAAQTDFFQDVQFDPDLKEGTDPIKYELGRDIRIDPGAKERLTRGRNVGLAKFKKAKLKRDEAELEGHENKEAILKILRSE